MKISELRKEFLKRGIPFVDRHTHSISKYTESFDLNKSPPIEGPWMNVVEEAIKIGLEEIAITDHSYEIFINPQMEPMTKLQERFFGETFDKYLTYLDKVKRKFSGIKFIRGIELKLRDDKDLALADIERLKLLDVVLIETLEKNPNFNKIRNKFGEQMNLIYAHPDPGYSCDGSSPEENVRGWVNNMVENNIYFDLNRQWIKKFLSDDPIYPTFFKIAKERGLLFSIGSDYHGEPGNYERFYERVLELINRYDLPKESFIRLK